MHHSNVSKHCERQEAGLDYETKRLESNKGEHSPVKVVRTLSQVSVAFG